MTVRRSEAGWHPAAAAAAGLALGCALLVAAQVMPSGSAPSVHLASAAPATRPNRLEYARPAALPPGSGAGLSQAAVDLGARLFADPRLSGDGTMSCATCHPAQLAFTDGQPRHNGRHGAPLARHTPALWNLAWSETLFWDGRAKTLEEQARGPIEHADEMAGSLPAAAARLATDARMAAAFAAAFPADPAVSPSNLLAALAAYERTLVSPRTRFDRWVAGEESALDDDEKAGFDLFNGKAGCSACHSGWRFSDEAFHDIGLPGTSDRGRGAVIGLAAADHAFKTPSLRELAWTAPYMHDGSLASLDDVLDHYATGVARRPTLSKDMPPVLALTPGERSRLLAFLGTLSSDDAPRPPNALPKVETAALGAAVASVATLTVGQKDKRFSPAAVALTAGARLTIVNDDKRTHNVRIDDPRRPFVSEAQEPGDSVVIDFPDPGHYGVICAIHPTMKLDVTVSPPATP